MASVRRLVAGGTSLDLLDQEDLLEILAGRLREPRRPLVLASSNLDHLTHFGWGGRYPDPALDRDVDWLVTADGRPIVLAARRLTGRAWPQLAGSDLLPTLLDVAEREDASVGFLGGWPEQHERLRRRLARDWPELRVVGYWSPSKDEVEDEAGARALAREIAAARTDLLVVGLGKPRQELWLRGQAVRSGARVAVAFGAAADFLAGTSIRAPRIWRSTGLEWLYRLLHEPRRLWRRYLVQGPVALWRLIRHSRA
jgi:N-acetylglucosaminyldiphosphoundecaprenol N-acetyl-beta-D-mannosaminyltransferase